MDKASNFPILLPNLSFHFLSLLHHHCRLHHRFTLHFKACVLFINHVSYTHRFISLIMIVCNFVFICFLVLLIIAVDTNNTLLFLFFGIIIFLLFIVVHVYISAIWRLTSVISVFENVYGSAAMRKSFELLKGRTRMDVVLVGGYLTICGVINLLLGSIVIRGGDYYGVFTRFIVGGFFVGVLVIVNIVGLLVQSVFYYVCKSFHHQTIDKSALYEHLGGYLGECMPLKSSVRWRNCSRHCYGEIDRMVGLSLIDFLFVVCTN